jgi:hypothetical protein
MSPQVSVFSRDGKKIKSFYAYDRDMQTGIKVSVSDVNGDGKEEMMVGSDAY